MLSNLNPRRLLSGAFAAIARALAPAEKISTELETGESRAVSQIVNYQSFSTNEMIGRTHFQRVEWYTPVRDTARARMLWRIAQIEETDVIVNILAGDTLSSDDGDDIGFSIPEDLEDGSLIDPKVREIGNALIKRCLSADKIVPIVEGFLLDGDCFRAILLDQGITKIIGLKMLPTWEMFRIEDENEQIVQFEQRRYQSQEGGEYIIHPAICVHWRYRPRRRYGRSLFEFSIDTAENLETSYFNLKKAGVSVGTNANLHIMPEGWGVEQTDAYRREYENRLKQNTVTTDFYMFNGGEVKKVSSQWPDLKALQDNVQHFRLRLAATGRIPMWMLGVEQNRAKDIAGGPQLFYSRTIGMIRQTLTVGLKQIIDLELALNGIYDAQYRIVFPKIYTSTIESDVHAEGEGGESGETNSPGVQDLDSVQKYLNSVLSNNRLLNGN